MLGCNEVEDLHVVVCKIKEDYNENANFILWGRSMGAVTALGYLIRKNPHSIFLAVLDSPFLNVKEVIC